MFKTLTGTTSLLGECPVWCERAERLFWTDMNDRFWPRLCKNAGTNLDMI